MQMQRTATIQVFDVMDTVQWSVTIREYPDYHTDEPPTVHHADGFMRGEGHEFWPHWLMDVLCDIQQSY
jgi:hypothetical protein